MTEYYTMCFRIYPDEKQQDKIETSMSACQTIYNLALQDMICHYEHTDEIIQPRLKEYTHDHHLDLSNVDPMGLSYMLLQLHHQFTEQILKDGLYPHFKENHNKQSYRVSARGGRIKVEENYLSLPKIGQVEILLHRPLPKRQRPINITIVRTCSYTYFANILFFRPIIMSDGTIPDEENTLGLDYSSPNFYVDSNGNSPEHPRFYEGEKAKIKRMNRKLSRMQKCSNNYEKQRRKLARLYEKISNRRRDWLHKESRRLANQYRYIAVENLQLQKIAGTYKLGSNTMDNGYGIFVKMLSYKMSWMGNKLVKINRWVKSSQICNHCGFVNGKLELQARFWVCPSCGKRVARDHNAAKNIRDRLIL